MSVTADDCWEAVGGRVLAAAASWHGPLAEFAYSRPVFFFSTMDRLGQCC